MQVEKYISKNQLQSYTIMTTNKKLTCWLIFGGQYFATKITNLITFKTEFSTKYCTISDVCILIPKSMFYDICTIQRIWNVRRTYRMKRLFVWRPHIYQILVKQKSFIFAHTYANPLVCLLKSRSCIVRGSSFRWHWKSFVFVNFYRYRDNRPTIGFCHLPFPVVVVFPQRTLLIVDQ